MQRGIAVLPTDRPERKRHSNNKLDRCPHTGPATPHSGSNPSERNSVVMNPIIPTTKNKTPRRPLRHLRRPGSGSDSDQRL